MRKKILALIMVATMLATTLVGCGKDTTSENTIDETVNVESTESVEPTESTESSGTLGDIANEPIESETPSTEDENENESEVEETTEYGEDYYLKFPFDETVASGYTHKFEYLNDTSMSYNETHYENFTENFTIDISWIGNTSIGKIAAFNSNQSISLRNEDENKVLIVNTPKDFDEDTWNEYLLVDENEWKETGYCSEYTGNEEFLKTIDENIIDIIFTIDSDSSNMKGYGRTILNSSTNKMITFFYMEDRNIYDDEISLSTIKNSQITIK